MKGGNRKRALLVSSVVILLCMTIIAGMTFALFTDTVRLTNHLQAGTLDMTLIRTKLIKTELDNNTGFLVDNSSDERVDFSDKTDRNVFDIDPNKTLIVPGSMYSAQMQLINHTDERKSDVAFNYWLEITFPAATNLILADQITVTVKTDKGEISKRLSQKDLLNGSAVLGAEDSPIGVIAKTGSATFTVTITFENLDPSVNNNAKNLALDFDLVVHAAQQLRSN